MATREEIAAACRRLAADGLVLGSAGNVSVYDGSALTVTATGARFEAITAEEVTVVAADGTVDGPSPTSEVALHLRLARDRGPCAVVHTHSPLAVAVGLVVDELPCVHYQQLLLGGAVRVAPYATFGTDALADAAQAALAGKRAALLANHGSVVVGADLAEAVELARLLEWACGVYQAAAAIGTPRVLDAEQQQAVVEQVVRLGYGR